MITVKFQYRVFECSMCKSILVKSREAMFEEQVTISSRAFEMKFSRIQTS